MFHGRFLAIATKHCKEKVIAPILERELGVKCIVPKNIDTDVLGTFTGEIERRYDPVTTARNKCLMAMELENCDLAIASEGSFGSHPTLFFAQADEEFLLFLDKKNNVEIIVRELSLETNFNGSMITSTKELNEFSEKAKFPSHGLIIRKTETDFSVIEKGITNETRLLEVYERFSALYKSVYVETDMRAMYNPSRMKVIENATQKLASKINSLCPDCNMPGLGITDALPGLPCELCNFPTKSTLKSIYKCQKCDYSKEEKFPNNRQFEDPTYCDFCNP